MSGWIAPELACNIRKRSVLKPSVRGRLVKPTSISTKIVSTFSDTKHITYIMRMAFINK